MEKNQYKLCVEVLRRLERAGVLEDVMLIGSWCVPFYKDYFGSVEYSTAIKTRDIDFLVPTPSKTKTKADIPKLLKDLGFIVNFRGSAGYIKLEHIDLIIEFLVPERGRGSDMPYRLPQYGLNAQTLRFLGLLVQNTIMVKVEGIKVKLPHPVNFALHKLIIFQRRATDEKATKDRNAAVAILKALIAKGEAVKTKHVFDSMLPKWQKKIMKGLEEAKEMKILITLQNAEKAKM